MDVAPLTLLQTWAKCQGVISPSCAGPVQRRDLNEALTNRCFSALLPDEPRADGGGCGDGVAPALPGISNEPPCLF